MKQIKLLLVTGKSDNIDSSPEVVYLTSLQNIKVIVLSGYVSARTLYDAVKEYSYSPAIDIVHFASHTSDNPPRLHLNGDQVGPGDLGQVLRRAKATLVFFNSCNSGQLASYVVQNSVDWAIYTNIELPDKDAWKMPLLFYENLDKQLSIDPHYNVPKAFKEASPGNGTYGITGNYRLASNSLIQQRLDSLQKWLTILFLAGTLQFILFSVLFIWVLLTKNIFVF